jgi:acyl-CoA reductase-like NAD-dependent aldehyde dehydrogenase
LKLSNQETNTKTVSIFSPSDGELIAERELANEQHIQTALKNATQAQAQWQGLSIQQRANYCEKAVAWFIEHQDEIAQEISQQMGRPIQVAKGEIKGLKERADYMISIAGSALADKQITKQRFIRHKALGNVFIIAPWNYPYLTAINSIIPALMAGNCVILKHASQTLLCAERFAEAFSAAGLPQGIFHYLHLSHRQTLELIQQDEIHYVSFTGSVGGGKIIEENLAGYFKPLGLELGGKDAAYVRQDANLSSSIENLVDGAFFNSGQSCCAVERIYVERPLFEKFVEGFIAQTKKLKLGHALDSTTSLGPMINQQAILTSQQQMQDALEKGATTHINNSDFPLQNLSTKGSYLAPQVFSNVNHDMQIMIEESFAPIIGIMPVDDDQQAIELINDSEFGLTASIWTQDEKSFLKLSEQIQAGTVFMNRCDYLDPALPWSGLKNSGRGCSLSYLAYQQLTQSQAIHIRSEHN